MSSCLIISKSIIIICCVVMMKTVTVAAENDNGAQESFFDFVDTDNDGTIEEDELYEFIRHTIGGKSFDESTEVNDEIQKILSKLDHFKDGSLTRGEMRNHWKSLDNLLGKDEVCEWIEYAVQMPKYIVAKFRNHGVSGHDFLSLVNNNGHFLKTELEIESSFTRKKIIRLMYVRLLGIGREPDRPSAVQVTENEFRGITITWEPSPNDDNYGFPVHKYRIERMNLSSETDHVGWETVYNGLEREFKDYSTSSKRQCIYRIDAWNAVGKSEWLTINENQPSGDNQMLLTLAFTILVIACSVAFFFWIQKKPDVIAKNSHNGDYDNNDVRNDGHVLISARFDGGIKEEKARCLYQELKKLNVKVYMVEASAGQQFGDKTIYGLTNMHAMIAVCFDNYGSKTASPYSTYNEVEYALQHKIRTLPIKLCKEWPPKPLDYDGSSKGAEQNNFFFKPTLVYSDWSKKAWDPVQCAIELRDNMKRLKWI